MRVSCGPVTLVGLTFESVKEWPRRNGQASREVLDHIMKVI